MACYLRILGLIKAAIQFSEYIQCMVAKTYHVRSFASGKLILQDMSSKRFCS